MLIRFLIICVYASATTLNASNKLKPAPVCKTTFQVAYLDRLNNTNPNIPSSSAKDIQKRLDKLGDVCYAGDDKQGDLLFFIHTSPAVYHGRQVYTNTSSTSAAATSGHSAAAAASTSTSTTAIPYSVDYSVFVLDIERMQPDGTFRVIHTFDQEGLYYNILGIGFGKGKHPIPNVIDAGAKWVHDEYLGGNHNSNW